MKLRSGRSTDSKAERGRRDIQIILRRFETIDNKPKMFRTPAIDKREKSKIPLGISALPTPLHEVVTNAMQNRKQNTSKEPTPIQKEAELGGAMSLPLGSNNQPNLTFEYSKPQDNLQSTRTRDNVPPTRQTIDQFADLDDGEIDQMSDEIRRELSYRKLPNERYTGTIPRTTRDSIL